MFPRYLVQVFNRSKIDIVYPRFDLCLAIAAVYRLPDIDRATKKSSKLQIRSSRTMAGNFASAIRLDRYSRDVPRDEIGVL